MLKRYLFLLVTGCFCIAAKAQNAGSGTAAQDITVRSGSEIGHIWLHDNKVKELANLGMLWGFVKYHHANVNKGRTDMDAALFRVLPQVLAADNTDSVNAIMERWVDGFGIPEPCKKCKPFTKTESTKLEPDYGYLFADNNLPRSLRDKLEYIKQNRYPGNDRYYIDAARGVQNPVFKNEREYATAYPDAGVRLLALYRYWNMIQYFCPNRHLIEENWNKALGQMIPDFCNATNVTEYQVACLKMITRIHDTHGAVITGMDSIAKLKGDYMTPFSAQFIEDKLVVTGYYNDGAAVNSNIKRGDIIEQIDGTPVPDLIRKYIPLVPASNYEKKLSNMARSIGFLLRSNNINAALSIIRDGKQLNVIVQRIKVDSLMPQQDYTEYSDCGYKVINGNIGYLYPSKLKDNDLETIRDAFEKTKGIVIDMRCYPSVFMTFNYGKWLKAESSPFVRFTRMNVDMPGSFETGDLSSNGGGKGSHYQGKVVILVNARTQSSAEYQTMALQTTPGAKVIGSQTSGADGNVSDIPLPGGIKTKLSGIGILYPDGSESQRAGVKIDKEVRPTIAGIREGRDEVLEEAIRMLND